MIDDGYLKVWAELVAAYYGKASHGDTAEIYAYLLMPYLPLMDHPGAREAALTEAGSAAHRRMVALCRQFERLMNCRVEFDPGHWVGTKGLSIDEWQVEGHPFTARVLVKVDAQGIER